MKRFIILMAAMTVLAACKSTNNQNIDNMNSKEALQEVAGREERLSLELAALAPLGRRAKKWTVSPKNGR